MKSLDEIACTEQTDRSSAGWHDYFQTYEQVLGHLRDKPITLVEIGVLGGGGLRTWARWFTHPNAKIIGVDIETFRYSGCQDGRVSVIKGDASSALTTGLLPDPIDILIDDGSHMASQQFRTFSLLWHRIVPGGFYCIEDLHTAWSPQHCDSNQTIMQWLTDRTNSIQGRGPDAQAKHRHSDIGSILIRNGLAILRKHST